ncbi:hypothetical protein [Paraglaciecola sp.]|uniref:hypothetical protein n=1 Tax=Paraglaciecola sp. TaxID=1920173 RepID=UPI00273D8439|nr:hypothetical protein [Paraglaciecola sp.]MDP5029135.1 hypothetical protein [Paraglaciecola sp.]
MSNKAIFCFVFFSLTLLEIGQLAISQEHPIIINQGHYVNEETETTEAPVKQATATGGCDVQLNRADSQKHCIAQHSQQ